MISIKKLEELMKKGKAPSRIIFNGKEFEYLVKDCSIKERLKDIEKYGIWNNGGYVATDKYGNVDYFIDELEYVYDGVTDENEEEIYVLPEGKKVGQDKETDNDINKAIEKLIEKKVKELMDKGVLKENAH